jgi:predicted ATPase
VTLLGIHERGCDNSFKSGVVLREEISRHGGIAVESFGEEMIVAFSTAGDALSCAAASQSRILNTSQEVAKAPPGIAMALHTAELTLANGGCYPDGALGRARRLLNATHPAQILCSESTAGLLRYDLNGGLRLRDLGVYRLRGASGSERLFQLDYPGGPVTLPALDAEAGFASHIPLQLTRFFGRQHELRSLEEMLLDSTRLVTLIGPPGCGKSRLAIEMANRLVAPFHGRVWFVPLADHQGDRFVFDLALQPLGINRLPQATPLTQIAAAIADDRALIVLDNFEHLVERAGEINDLLAAVPRLHCLVTSRRRLNLVGEQEFPVDPLTIPDPAAPDLFRNECVELFVDRAQAVRPDFQLTEQNTTTVADICRKLEGIPLSIELAARRTGVLGLSQIRDRAGRAEDLMSPNRDVENRHRSLRAAIKWSYELLPAEIQRFFACLSTFRGGWTTEAAAVVCDEPLALDYLSELADCSLISVHHGSQDPRFHMLEMVRAYAAERLAESGLQAAARQLHAKYFEELAIRAYAGMEGPDLPAWLHRLDADIANITCALDWFESTRSFEKAIWLVTRLFRFWSERGHHVTALHLFDRILNLDTESRRTKAHASGLEIVGNLRDDMGDFVGAQEAFAESLSIFEELADRRSVAGVLSNMSCVERNRGDYALARTHLEQALGINRELGNRLWESFNLDNLSVLARTAGDYQTARLFTEEALALHRELGDRRSEGLALGNLGTTLWLLGDRAEGHRLAVQSRQVSRQVGEAYSSFFNNLIYMKTELGEFASARTLLEEESELIRQRLLPARAPSLLANVGCLILAWPSPGGEMWMPQLADE